MGQNIGTCVTALLSSIGTNKNARRAAMVHLMFNIIGTVVWLSVFCIVNAAVRARAAGRSRPPCSASPSRIRCSTCSARRCCCRCPACWSAWRCWLVPEKAKRGRDRHAAGRAPAGHAPAGAGALPRRWWPKWRRMRTTRCWMSLSTVRKFDPQAGAGASARRRIDRPLRGRRQHLSDSAAARSR